MDNITRLYYVRSANLHGKNGMALQKKNNHQCIRRHFDLAPKGYTCGSCE
jgi:hypothetical protein